MSYKTTVLLTILLTIASSVSAGLHAGWQAGLAVFFGLWAVAGIMETQ